MGITYVLRLCCLLEKKPYPYEKWLYREAMKTRLGSALGDVMQALFAELSYEELRTIEPETIVRPGHRDGDLEKYPIYQLWLRMKATIDEHYGK